ncbi:MAG: hypothetical protein HRU29_11545 [Rhizobiales bacterium]|nr:hypothetical protein [Hyphomicrobiales bacterium]NRB15023.1 hypothetical protein [Hyphomicrobiales bacterium]
MSDDYKWIWRKRQLKAEGQTLRFTRKAADLVDVFIHRDDQFYSFNEVGRLVWGEDNLANLSLANIQNLICKANRILEAIGWRIVNFGTRGLYLYKGDELP